MKSLHRLSSFSKMINVSSTMNKVLLHRQAVASTTSSTTILFYQPNCQFCHQRQQGTVDSHTRQLKRSFHTFKPLLFSSSGALSKEGQAWALDDNACPQGVQGDVDLDNATFKLWLDNCHRYGLANCDQQLQGIQTGRKNLAEVIAEQDALIAEIAKEYQERNAMVRQMGGKAELFPDINTPCPQGVQGEDCVRFKLWLENCHRFGVVDCKDQLDNYSKGRKTLAQILEEQDQMIREASVASQQRGIHGASASTTQGEGVEESNSGPMTSGQKLKNAVKVYGSTVMVFHVSISLLSLGFFYTLVSSGIDVVGILSRLGIGESIIQSKLATGAGTFVVAYAVHKVFAPARIAATLTATPLIVRYLRGIGFLKTPPKK